MITQLKMSLKNKDVDQIQKKTLALLRLNVITADPSTRTKKCCVPLYTFQMNTHPIQTFLASSD